MRIYHIATAADWRAAQSSGSYTTSTLADGLSLVRREFPTAIGPVDLMCRDAHGKSVAV